MIELGSIWGSWYGVATAIAADVDDDAGLTWALMGGNLGLVASALATRNWKMSAGRVRIISAAGLGGGVAGLGLDLLADVHDEATAVLIPAITSALGLVGGAIMTRDFDSGSHVASERGLNLGLVNFNASNWNIGLPELQVWQIPPYQAGSAPKPSLGARIALISGRF
jgi:hypothetical protein